MKTMNRTIPFALILCIALSLILTACSGGKNLADYAKQQNDLFKSTNSDTMSIDVKAEGKTLIYTFKYGIELDVSSAQTALDSQATAYNTVISTAEAAGYKVDAVKLVIVDKDNKQLASKDIKK